MLPGVIIVRLVYRITASSLFKSIKGTGSKLIRASTYSPWNGAVNAKAPVRPLGLGGG